MKPILKFFFPCVAIVFLLTYSGCGPTEPPTPEVAEVKHGLLLGQWKMTGATANATLDGVPKKTDYANFTLTISGAYTDAAGVYDYATAGRPALSPWPSQGKWSFGADPATQLVRDKGTAKQVDMSYSVTETSLEITFQYSGTGESRTSNVSGTWVFTFSK
jgi:hypothetical protein